MRCPIQREFLRLINMSPAEMRRWTKDTKSRCYNYTEDAPRTRKIADLKAKNRKRWTSEDCALASAAVAYVKRMKSAASGKQLCHPQITGSLRSWGHRSRCAPRKCEQLSETKLAGTPRVAWRKIPIKKP